MLNQLGNISLFLAWFLALYAVVSGGWLLWSNKTAQSGTLKAVVAGSGFSGLTSVAILTVLFLSNDYANLYVWQHSNLAMPAIYKMTAVWGGMAGSMLLWASLLSLFAAIAVLTHRTFNQRFFVALCVALASSCLFFFSVVLFATNPFEFIAVDIIPPDGNGLNPLLQNPYMAIHPPTLYLGFTALSVPYAYAVAALLSGELNLNWIKSSARWAIISWFFLTAGITLGGHWAYIELGWGGFWAWDPVENSSLFPWLITTAYLHSVLVQEKRGMLKIWNISLIVLAYSLTVFGTFLTRSGIVQSVHAFAKTNIGWLFLVYLGLILVISAFLIFYRRRILRPEEQVKSLFSREMFFLVNNLLLLAICFATVWGVLFPVFSEWATGQKQAVGIPFFNAINVPLFLVLFAFMAVGPFVAWRQQKVMPLLKQNAPALILSFLMAVTILVAGEPSFYSLTAYSIAFFMVLSLSIDYHRQVARRKKTTQDNYLQSAYQTFNSKRRKYAAHLVHCGVAVAIVAITAAMSGKVEEDFSLAVGESKQVAGYSLELNNIRETENGNFAALIADVTAYTKGQQLYGTLEPELRQYFRNKESTTEVALKMGLKNDLYLVLAGLDQTGTRASFKVFVNPLQIWLWVGVLIMLLGTLLILSDRELRVD